MRECAGAERRDASRREPSRAARLAPDALPANVPDLERDALAADLHAVDEEVEPDRLLVRAAEVVVAEARRDARLADRAVTEEDDLELQRLVLVLVVVRVLRAHGRRGG